MPEAPGLLGGEAGGGQLPASGRADRAPLGGGFDPLLPEVAGSAPGPAVQHGEPDLSGRGGRAVEQVEQRGGRPGAAGPGEQQFPGGRAGLVGDPTAAGAVQAQHALAPVVGLLAVGPQPDDRPSERGAGGPAGGHVPFQPVEEERQEFLAARSPLGHPLTGVTRLSRGAGHKCLGHRGTEDIRVRDVEYSGGNNARITWCGMGAPVVEPFPQFQQGREPPVTERAFEHPRVSLAAEQPVDRDRPLGARADHGREHGARRALAHGVDHAPRGRGESGRGLAPARLTRAVGGGHLPEHFGVEG